MYIGDAVSSGHIFLGTCYLVGKHEDQELQSQQQSIDSANKHPWQQCRHCTDNM